MSHSFTSCLFHCVFSTKGRRQLLSDDLRERLWAYLGGVARDHQMKALAVGGTADHVHVLLSVPATTNVAHAVQLLKGASSKWIHDTFPAHGEFAWQQGYAAFSIGVAGVEQTVAYINGQAEHHRTHTFEQEYSAFLARHGFCAEG